MHRNNAVVMFIEGALHTIYYVCLVSTSAINNLFLFDYFQKLNFVTNINTEKFIRWLSNIKSKEPTVISDTLYMASLIGLLTYPLYDTIFVTIEEILSTSFHEFR